MKPPPNLSELYATMVEARPEMAVELPHTNVASLRLRYSHGCWAFWVWLHGRAIGTGQSRNEHEAAGLILSHWQEALPEPFFLMKSANTWGILRDVGHAAIWYPDQITALFHFHTGVSK